MKSDWLKQYWGDAIVIAILIRCIIGLAEPLIFGYEADPQWHIVYITGIYSILTLYTAVGAIRSAKAAESSIALMQESLEEQRQSRWAQFAPVIALTAGNVIEKVAEDTYRLRISNLYAQPMTELRALAWFMESGPDGTSEVRFSSMLISEPIDVHADKKDIVLTLYPSNHPESVRKAFGEEAFSRFEYVYKNKCPQNVLCAIIFGHRAAINPSILVYDLSVIDISNQSLFQ